MNRRILLLSIAVLFLLSSSVFAKEKEDAMISLYGKGLYNVPAVVRIQFQSATNKVWHDVSVEERRAFLVKWEESRKAVVRNKETYIKGLSEKEKMIRAAQKARLNEQRVRAKANADKLKAAAIERRARNQKVAAMKKQREEARQRLRKMQAQRNRRRH